MRHLVSFPNRPVVGFLVEDIAADPPTSCLSDWHRAYFCPKCGRVWARWEKEGAEEWFPISRSCEAHQTNRLEVPGSLLMDKRYDLHILPPELLVRELMLGWPWQGVIHT